MGYHVVEADSVEPREGLPGTHHYLEDEVELESLSVQVIVAAPGESFAPFHAHSESEEVFYVLQGELYVETPDKEYAVSPGEWFAVEPGNPLRPFNPEDSDEPVQALLLNANRSDFEPYDPEE